jgi:protein SMG6
MAFTDSDTGIMPRLREAYKAIQALEQSLSDLHRRMSTDPSGGLRVLIHFKGTNPRFAEPSTLVFEPNLGTGAAGILRQAEDAQEFSRHESKSSPTVAAYDSDQRPLSTAEENEAWVDLVLRHKRLADAHHDFLILCLDPLIPASLHNLPVKYNIPTRLWQTAFHLLLERMRHTWVVNSPAVRETPYSVNRLTNTTFPPSEDPVKSLVLDHLTDFIYDAYSFYTNLLEETSLTNFKTAWLEALGDLARYRMAVAAHVTALGKPSVATKHTPTINAVLGRIDDDIPSSGASIGAEVAENWDVEERETWRITARDWYVLGLVDKPGEGRLHHHLGLLCRDVRGEEIRALYHFTKRCVDWSP